MVRKNLSQAKSSLNTQLKKKNPSIQPGHSFLQAWRLLQSSFLCMGLDPFLAQQSAARLDLCHLGMARLHQQQHNPLLTLLPIFD